MFTVRTITDRNRSQLEQFFDDISSTHSYVSKGIIYHFSALEGFVAYLGTEIVGFLTYNIKDKAMEVIALEGNAESKDVTSSLLDLSIQKAQALNLEKVWTIATNDNIPRMQFYEKKDFQKAQIHFNSVRKARAQYPEIPEKGYQDIPILHEIEFEYRLKS
jgi:hypothetical protein